MWTQSDVGPVLVYNCCFRAIIFGRMEITTGYGHLYRLVSIQNFLHALWDTRGSLCTSETLWWQSGIIMREISVIIFGHCIDTCINTYVPIIRAYSALQRVAVFFRLQYIGTLIILIWDEVGLALGQYIIYVWFWKLGYANHVKVSQLTSSSVTGKIKTNQSNT